MKSASEIRKKNRDIAIEVSLPLTVSIFRFSLSQP